MITKERLEELTKQGTKVYYVNKKIKEIFINTDNTMFYKDYVKIKMKGLYNNTYYENKYFNRFFETQEEAEFYKNFGNIKRTERLNLPTWERLNEILENQGYFEIEFSKNEFEDVSLYIANNKMKIVITGLDYMSGFDGDFNKESYFNICKEIKNMFLSK